MARLTRKDVHTFQPFLRVCVCMGAHALLYGGLRFTVYRKENWRFLCVTSVQSLSMCMRVYVCLGDDKTTRKGQVLTLLAEQALQCLDFKTSYIHCQDLMAAGMWAWTHVSFFKFASQASSLWKRHYCNFWTKIRSFFHTLWTWWRKQWCD